MPENQDEREREERRRQLVTEEAELWQRILRQELAHRKSLRDLLEQHERVIGLKVRQLREERGWSQADLARKLDEAGWPLHQTNISKLEAGRRPVRVAEAAALALVFGLPVIALWYLPVEGEPRTLTEMRARLREIDDTIATIEGTARNLVAGLADEQYRRTRLVEAMNAAALAAERGELEDANLSREEADTVAEVMYHGKRPPSEMTPGEAAYQTMLQSMNDGTLMLKQLADEAFRMQQSGSGLDEMARLVAASMPQGVPDPMKAAARIIRETLGPPETTKEPGQARRERR